MDKECEDCKGHFEAPTHMRKFCDMCLKIHGRQAALKHYGKNPKKEIERGRCLRTHYRDLILDLYGNKCNRCGITEKCLLHIDHINYIGRKNRDTNGYWCKALYEKILNNKSQYQILCPNCNWIKKIELKEFGDHAGRGEMVIEPDRTKRDRCFPQYESVEKTCIICKLPFSTSKYAKYYCNMCKQGTHNHQIHHYSKYSELFKSNAKKYQQKLRNMIFDAYGGCCRHCGFDDRRVLQIDHIKSVGSKGHKRFSSLKGAQEIIDHPEIYQILCPNCNWLKYILYKEQTIRGVDVIE